MSIVWPAVVTVPSRRFESPRNSATKTVPRPEVEVLRRADLLDPAVIHEADAIGHRHRFVLIVRDVEDGDAEPMMEILDLELHVIAQLAVERAERLVHQDDRGAVDHASGERDALLLTAGERARQPLRDIRQLDDVENTLHLGDDRRLGQAPHAQRKGDVLVHRQMREERVVLEDDADVALVRRGRRSPACRRSRSRRWSAARGRPPS